MDISRPSVFDIVFKFNLRDFLCAPETTVISLTLFTSNETVIVVKRKERYELSSIKNQGPCSYTPSPNPYSNLCKKR